MEKKFQIDLDLDEIQILQQCLFQYIVRHPQLKTEKHSCLLNSFEGVIMNHKQEKN